jgi:Flp pilus assembly protein TadG
MRTGKSWNRRGATERGSAFIEFAIVSLIMIPIFFAVIDYSRVFYYGAIVQGAARAGTQYAVNAAPNEAAITSVQSAASADAVNVPSSQSFSATASFFCACSNSTTQVSCSSTCDSGYTLGTYSQVNTQLTFTTFFKYPLLPTSITVTGQSIVQVH